MREREPRSRLATAASLRFLLRLATDQPTKDVDIVNLCCVALGLQFEVLRFSPSLGMCVLNSRMAQYCHSKTS